MENTGFIPEGGVELAVVENKIVNITVNEILKVFKANEEIETIKMQAMRSAFHRGTVRLRGFERVLFGTGLYVNIPEGYQLVLRTDKEASLAKALVLLDSPSVLKPGFKGEITVAICNLSSFLSAVEKNEVVAIGTFEKI